MEPIKTRKPVTKLMTAREWVDFEARLAKVFEKPPVIEPKARQLPAFHEAEVKRLNAKMAANPDAMHRDDWHALMTAKSVLQFPDLAPVKAYAKFVATKEGLDLMRQYNDAPPGPDVLEPQPQMPPVGKAMAKMDALAKKFVQDGTAATIAKGYVLALAQEPSLYTQYLDEMT